MSDFYPILLVDELVRVFDENLPFVKVGLVKKIGKNKYGNTEGRKL